MTKVRMDSEFWEDGEKDRRPAIVVSATRDEVTEDDVKGELRAAERHLDGVQNDIMTLEARELELEKRITELKGFLTYLGAK